MTMPASGKGDLAHIDRYRQRKGLYAKELTGGPNNARHVDLLTQLLNERQLGLNVTHIDTRLDEVDGRFLYLQVSTQVAEGAKGG